MSDATEEIRKEAVKPEKKPKSAEFNCPFCKKTFNTRSGLWKHLQKCTARPDIEEDEPDSDESVDDGISLWEEEEEEEIKFDAYQCPVCRYTKKMPFDTCPRCGTELEWD